MAPGSERSGEASPRRADRDYGALWMARQVTQLDTVDAPLAPCIRFASMLVLTAIYAVCFTAIKIGLDYAPPLRFASSRVLVAGIALLAVAAARREPLKPPRESLRMLLLLSLVATTIAYGAMFLSPGRTGAGIASVLGNTQPLFAVGLAAVFLDERMSVGKAAALGLGIGGMVLISYPGLTGPGKYGISGAILAVAVSAGAASGGVIIKRMQVLSNLVSTTAWSLLLGGLPLLAASWLVESKQSVIWKLEFVGLLLFLSLVGTALAAVWWYWLVQRHDVGYLTLYFFLVPVFGLTIAALAFDEPVGFLEGAGVAAIAAGIVVTAGEMIAGNRQAACVEGRRSIGMQ